MPERRITSELRAEAAAYARRFVAVRVFAFLLLHVLALIYLDVVPRTIVVWVYGAAYATVEYRRIARDRAAALYADKMKPSPQ